MNTSERALEDTSVAQLTAPGGTLLVIAAVCDSTAQPLLGSPASPCP